MLSSREKRKTFQAVSAPEKGCLSHMYVLPTAPTKTSVYRQGPSCQWYPLPWRWQAPSWRAGFSKMPPPQKGYFWQQRGVWPHMVKVHMQSQPPRTNSWIQPSEKNPCRWPCDLVGSNALPHQRNKPCMPCVGGDLTDEIVRCSAQNPYNLEGGQSLQHLKTGSIPIECLQQI